MSHPPRLILALDFGGTKLAAGLVDLTGGELLQVGRTETPGDGGAAATFEAMIALSSQLALPDHLDGVGVSFGGHVREGQIVRSLHVPGWEDFPLAQRLCDIFDVQRALIANDANAAALGEWRFGAGQGSESMLYVTVSTGIGGGLILNRRLFGGSHQMAGEIGHMKIMSSGPLCTCGKHGCLEALAAGPAITRRAGELLQLAPYATSSLHTVRPLTAAAIAEAANSGDALGVAVLREAGTYLGTGIANAINLLDIECVVVGGGVSRAGDVWWEAVQSSVQVETLNPPANVRLERSALGGHEALWGAAALFARP